jgi:thiamine-monophosphate kinase
MDDWYYSIIGRFFASINLSDIAAMGGIPQFFLSSMFFPKDFEFEKLSDLVKGMEEQLQKYGVTYLGGDLKESKIAGMSGIALGKVEKGKILRRRGAKIDEGVYITGALGKQAAGYYLWKNGHEDGWKYLLDVEPRILEGRELAGRASTCMDLSDGLWHTLEQMEKINNIGFKIDFDEIPIDHLAYEVSEDFGIPLEILVLSFGGEYELFFTAQSRILGREIGRVAEEGGVWKDGKRIGGEGYAHFSKALDKIRGQ